MHLFQLVSRIEVTALFRRLVTSMAITNRFMLNISIAPVMLVYGLVGAIPDSLMHLSIVLSL